MNPSRYARVSDAELQAALRLPVVGPQWADEIRAELERRERSRTRRDGGPESPARQPDAEPESQQLRAPPASGARQMNKTERKYADLLDAQGIEWLYEEIVLGIGAHRTTYRPDFYLPREHRFVEVKGAYMRDDARVKFMVAAKMWAHFGWTLVQCKDGGWRTLYHYPATGD